MAGRASSAAARAAAKAGAKPGASAKTPRRRPRTVRKYKYFPYPEYRAVLRRQIRKVLDTARSRNVQAVVALDVRGRAAAILFRYAWHTLYPKEPLPRIYHIKPHPFYSVGEFKGAELKRSAAEKAEAFRKRMKRDTPHLLRFVEKNPKAPILVLDDVIYSGGTMRSVTALLEAVGARNLIPTALGSTHEITPIEHIRGMPLGVSLKPKGSLVVGRLKDRQRVKARLRLELKQIAEGLKKNA